MKPLFVYLILFTISYAQELLLEKTYYFINPTILARDVFPQLEENFELFTIPAHLTHFNLAQHKLFELFNEHNITLAGTPRGLVHFKRKSNLNTAPLEEAVAAYFLEHLPFLTIGRVFIEPKSDLDVLPQSYTVEFKTQAYKNHQGTFKVLAQGVRHFFEFTLYATYSQFQAAYDIKKGETITAFNTKLSILPFHSIHHDLIGFDILSTVEAKRPLQKDRPITKRDVRPKTIVKRGAIVNVKLREDNILINFTATALSNGRMGDTIFIERDDASKLKAQVIGENKVQLK